MKIYGLSQEIITRALKDGLVTIEIFGMGKMGLPLAVASAEVGARVIGVDLNAGLTNMINQGKNPYPLEEGLDELLKELVETHALRAVSEPELADVYIILVPTVLDERKRPALSTLATVTETIAKLLKPGDLVIEESTVPPGTCQNILLPMLLRSGLQLGTFGLAHAPERTSSGRALKDIKGAYPKVMGGIDQPSTIAASTLYSLINSAGVIETSSIATAEAVKVFEGIYRDVNIALANELALLSQRWGINIMEAISAANTQPYSHIHTPGAGVGGHCIPVYPNFVSHQPEAEIIRLARRRNEEMPLILVSLALDEIKRLGVMPEEAKVLLMGIAFRPKVKENRYSPFYGARDALREAGARVFAWDPLYTREEIAALGVEPADSLAGMDAAILVTEHTEFIEMNWEAMIRKMNHPVVVDGRFVVPLALRDFGFSIRRIDGC